MPMNTKEITTDGDYPPTPRSGSEFGMDEQLASADGVSLDRGNGNGWGDESSEMWSWLTTDSDIDEDDLGNPKYTR